MSDMDYEAIAQQLRNCSEIAPGLKKGADAIDQLRARVADLEAERADIRAERDKAYTLSAEQEARIAELEAENERLRSALERIADRRNAHYGNDAHVTARMGLNSEGED